MSAAENAEKKIPSGENVRPFPKQDGLGLTRDEMQREIVRLHTKVSSLENAIEHFYEYFRARLAGMEKHQVEFEKMIEVRVDGRPSAGYAPEPSPEPPRQEPRMEKEIGSEVQQMILVSSIQQISNQVLERMDALERRMVQNVSRPAEEAAPETAEPVITAREAVPEIPAARTPAAQAMPEPRPNSRRQMGPAKGSAQWITNGVESTKIPINDEIPAGWRRGRAGAFGRGITPEIPATPEPETAEQKVEHPMADIADRAQQAQEAFVADSLTAHFNRSRLDACVRPLPQGKPVYCVDCGEQINPERLRVVKNAIRCAACQADYGGR